MVTAGRLESWQKKAGISCDHEKKKLTGSDRGERSSVDLKISIFVVMYDRVAGYGLNAKKYKKKNFWLKIK